MRIPIGITKEGERNPKHWIALTGELNVAEAMIDSHIDSSNNFYYVTTQSESSRTNAFIYKINDLGVFQIKKRYARSGVSDGIREGITTDSSQNMYVGSLIFDTSTYYFSKLNSSGVQQWQRTIPSSFFGTGFATDSSSNVYLTYQEDSFGAQRTRFLKFNTNGSIIWQRIIGDPNTVEPFERLYMPGSFIDSSQNLVSVGQTFVSNITTGDLVVIKYNSSGVLQWQRKYRGATKVAGFRGGRDSSNNIYAIAIFFKENTFSSKYDGALFKFNSSGDLVWQRVLSAGDSLQFTDASVDLDGNIYTTSTYSPLSGSSQQVICKHDSSGNLVWERSFAVSAGYALTVKSIRPGNNGNLYIYAGLSPAVNSREEHFVIAMPQDGSIYGSYKINGITISWNPSTFVSTSPSSFFSVTPPFTEAGTSLSFSDPGAKTVTDLTGDNYKIVL